MGDPAVLLHTEHILDTMEMNTFLKLKKQMGYLKILWISWTRVVHCKCTSSEALGQGF